MEVSFLRTTKVIKIATKGFSSLFKLTQEEASYMQEEKLLSMERNMHALCSFGLIWLISYPFLANKQYFFLAPNQPTVLSVMTYRSIKPIRRRATQAHHPLFFFSFFSLLLLVHHLPLSIHKCKKQAPKEKRYKVPTIPKKRAEKEQNAKMLF